MRVKWYGTATLLVETGSSRVLFDPYFHELNERLPKLPVEDFKDADAIFITHPHFDHFIDIDRITEVASKAPVYVSNRGIELAKEHGFCLKPMKEIQVGDLIQVGDMTVKIHQGKHCVFNHGLIFHKLRQAFCKKTLSETFRLWRLNRQFRIGSKNIFTFEIEADGKRMVIMGSANLDQKEINPHHMDVLVFPYQGRSDMMSYSAPMLEYFEPKKVILDHFDDSFPPLTTEMDCKAFVDYMKERNAGYDIVIPDYQEWIEI